MKFVERIEVPVPLAEAWDFMWEVQRVARCLPGCVRVEEIEPGKTYKARFEDHVGPYKVNFALNVVIDEADPPTSLRLLATGQDSRLGVSQKVALVATLRAVDAARTALEVDADVQVLGKMATLGQFVIQRKAKEVVKQFAANVARELQPAVGTPSNA